MTDPTPSALGPWRRRGRTAGRWALRIVVALTGALVAVLLFGRVSAPIGPFDATLAFRPGAGGAAVAVPPLGDLRVDPYEGPLRLDITLQRVDQARAQALATDPVRLAGVVDRVSENLQSAVVRLAWTTAGVAVAGAALASLVVFRRPREPLIAVGVTGALLVGTVIAIFRTQADGVFALEDRCPHKGGPLSQGIVFGESVACPLHNWCISLKSGAAVSPDDGQVARFDVRVVEGVVQLDPGPEAP